MTAPSRRRPSPGATWAGVGFVAPLVVYLVVLYASPLYENVSLSLHRYTRATFVTGQAPFTGLDIYREVVASPQFWPTLGHTAFFVLVSLFFQYTIGLALAVFFQRYFPLSPLLRALFLVPWLLPIIVSATTWQWMFNADSGIVNRFLGGVGIDPVWWLNADHSLVSVTIANIWLGIPFNLVILYSGLQNIPSSCTRRRRSTAPGGWRQVLADHLPAAAPGHRDHPAAGLRLHAQGGRHHLDHDLRGPGRSQTLATWAYGMAFGKGTSAVIRYSEASVVGTLLLLIALVIGLVYIVVQHRQEVEAR